MLEMGARKPVDCVQVYVKKRCKRKYIYTSNTINILSVQHNKLKLGKHVHPYVL
jgi:hypothetical protein